MTDRPPSSRLPLLCVLALTAIGAALRLVDLELHGYWLDELIAVQWADVPSFAAVLQQFQERSEVHPPGYHLLLHPLARAFGPEPWPMRLPSALAGIAAIPALYALTRRLASPAAALLAAALLAALFMPLEYSRLARPYSLAILLVILAALLATRVLEAGFRDEPYRRHAAGFVAVAFAACALLYYAAAMVGLIGVFALGLALVGKRWTLARDLVICGLALLVLCAPWAPSLLRQLSDPAAISGIERPGWLYPVQVWVHFFNDSLWLAGAAALVLAAAGLDAVMRRRPRSPRQRVIDAALLTWALLPGLLAILASQLLRPLVQPWSLLISLPAVLILLARALAGFLPEDKPGAAAVAALALTAALVLQLYAVRDFPRRPNWDQLREAANAVDAGAEAEEPIIAYASFGWGMDRIFDFYLSRAPKRRCVAFALGDEFQTERLEALLARPPPALWLLYRSYAPIERAPVVRRLRRAGYRVDRSESFKAAGALRFSRRR